MRLTPITMPETAPILGRCESRQHMTHIEKISRLLERKGWSLLELSRRADVGREQTRRMVRKVPSSVSSAIRIARALGVPADWLFDDDRDGAPSRPELRVLPPDLNVVVLRRELRKLLDALES